VPKQSSQSEMRCSSQIERLLHYTHLIRFFIFLSIAEVASLPRRQLASLLDASELCCTWSLL